MVFWAANPAAARKMNVESMSQNALIDDSMLMGFTVGDETAVPTLKIEQVKQPVTLQDGRTQGSHCIGCHTATPDGDYVAFVDAWPWSAAFAAVKPDMVGAALPGFSGGPCDDWNSCTQPKTFLQYPWNGPMTFSPAHWSLDDAGERIAIIATQVQDITMPGGLPVGPNWQPGRLAWVDVRSRATKMTGRQVDPKEGEAFGILARNGDPHPAAAFPTWSHDGESIVYVSVACPDPGHVDGCGTLDGRLAKGPADLYEVPYANKAGGAATPVAGASTVENDEYYPALSPDDRLLAFTRVKAGQTMYANKTAEMFVVSRRPAAVEATRLRANDPAGVQPQVEPGRQQPLAQMVAGQRRRRQQDLLLVDLLVEPLRAPGGDAVERRDRRNLAALHHGSRRGPDGRRGAGQDSPRHLPVEPAAGSAEHAPRLG